MSDGTASLTRMRLIEAADALAHEEGFGHISLDAVAARAGVSKGGLLYHFGSKSKLLSAVVAHHLEAFKARLTECAASTSGTCNGLALAYVQLSDNDITEKQTAPASGLIAALAEDPSALDPVRLFNRSLLDRFAEDSSDHATALVAFLAVEGLRFSQLLGMSVLSPQERATALRRLVDLVSTTQECPPGPAEVPGERRTKS